MCLLFVVKVVVVDAALIAFEPAACTDRCPSCSGNLGARDERADVVGAIAAVGATASVKVDGAQFNGACLGDIGDNERSDRSDMRPGDSADTADESVVCEGLTCDMIKNGSCLGREFLRDFLFFFFFFQNLFFQGFSEFILIFINYFYKVFLYFFCLIIYLFFPFFSHRY